MALAKGRHPKQKTAVQLWAGTQDKKRQKLPCQNSWKES